MQSNICLSFLLKIDQQTSIIYVEVWSILFCTLKEVANNANFIEEYDDWSTSKLCASVDHPIYVVSRQMTHIHLREIVYLILKVMSKNKLFFGSVQNFIKSMHPISSSTLMKSCQSFSLCFAQNLKRFSKFSRAYRPE